MRNNYFCQVNNLIKITLLFGILFISTASYSQIQEHTDLVSDDVYTTYGTFQFDYPNETKLFWSIDFMESLYPEIEQRRQDEVVAFWHYSPDVTIIIYSKEVIESPNFKRISPFDGFKSPY